MPDQTPAEPVPANTVAATTVPANTAPAEAGPAIEAGAAQAAGAAPADGAAEGASRLVRITDSGPMIVATVVLPDCEPSRALAAFTDPVVLARWWRGELTADLVEGGQYSVSFPAIPARMVGNIVSYAPGELLEFTWAWDGKDRPPTTVTVRTRQGAGDQSTVLTIEHGPHYGDEGGRTAHAEHWEGWEFFLPRLQAAVSG
jgi:uncharacterized protein YndB with AHSA1/START domain